MKRISVIMIASLFVIGTTAITQSIRFRAYRHLWYANHDNSYRDSVGRLRHRSQFICHYSRKPLHMPSMGLPMLHDTGWAEYRCRSPETGPKFRPHYHIYMV